MSGLLMKCGACSHEVSAKAAACPKCGHPTRSTGLFDLIKRYRPGRKSALAAALFAAFLAGRFTAKPQPVMMESRAPSSIETAPVQVQQGPVMRNGAYQEVSDYLRQASKDPDSTEIERCTKPKYDEKAGWLVGCAFRTNNAAGEMVKYANWFVIRGDKVVKLLSANAYRME